MEPSQLLERFKQLKSWKKKGERAPHKPLLLLYALGRLERGQSRLFSYHEEKENIKYLLKEFGPYRKVYHSRYPFVRLYNDGIWDLRGEENIDATKDYSDSYLEERGIQGGLSEEVFSLLSSDSKLFMELVTLLLEKNFPRSIHNDILQEVGLSLEPEVRRIRDPAFRERVLTAYSFRCAICGFNVRLGSTLVAVEAAHIKWHQAGGPDREENGVALCSMHHKLFDRGVFTLTPSMELIVAERAHGTQGFQEWLLRYHGKPIQRPQSPLYEPEQPFLDWHVREVFQGPARYRCSG